MQFRPYQIDIENHIYKAWADGHKNVLAVLPTGAGKTHVFAKILADHHAPCVAIAHRQELVGQISLALALRGVRHRIIGPKSVIKFIVQLQMGVIGNSFYDPNAPCAVAGVDTLVRRFKELEPWAQSVTLWVQDEAHHILTKNKWGKACAFFPYARGLGATAIPQRADGRGLGQHVDGVFDVIVEGPHGRELIEDGYLTDYIIYGPQSDIKLTPDMISAATGDYKPQPLKAAVRRSHIVGDVVEHYKRLASGKLGVTFCSDVETATDVAKNYNDNGVPAAVVSAKTPDTIRQTTIQRFQNRDLLQLVNVDLFGEGFDLPAIEVVSFARPTESYSVYGQQFGRVGRPMYAAGYDLSNCAGRLAAIAVSCKPRAIVIDHVGNVTRHRLPDRRHVWTLDRRESRKKRDQTQYRSGHARRVQAYLSASTRPVRIVVITYKQVYGVLQIR